MKLHYFLVFLGISALSTFTLHAQDVLNKQKNKKLSQFLVLSYPHKLVDAEKHSHNRDLVLARSRASSTNSHRSASSSLTPSPQRSPSISPREESKKLEVIHEKQPKQPKQARVVWQG